MPPRKLSLNLIACYNTSEVEKPKGWDVDLLSLWTYIVQWALRSKKKCHCKQRCFFIKSLLWQCGVIETKLRQGRNASSGSCAQANLDKKNTLQWFFLFTLERTILPPSLSFLPSHAHVHYASYRNSRKVCIISPPVWCCTPPLSSRIRKKNEL